MVRLFSTVAALRCYLDQYRLQPESTDSSQTQRNFSDPGRDTFPQRTIGLVPTMGALHAGHLSLIQRSRQDNDLVVVSIFVNPLQFGPSEDFARYPRTLEQDMALCREAGVDVIFAPTVEELYGDRVSSTQMLAGRTQVLPPADMTQVLCGRSRPGHFHGVTTVVTKLFNLVQPTRAYFGQKDAQQVAILRRMVRDLNQPVEVVVCPIVRESSGLALSSRNQYLSPQERDDAAVLYRALQEAVQVVRQGTYEREAILTAVKREIATVPAVELEYIELVDPVILKSLDTVQDSGLLAIAARLGNTRLIDNVVLRNRQPIVAIDGPAGAGKSTVTRRVADALGLTYLDTGAMYRAVTWLALTTETAIDDEPAIAEMVYRCQIEFRLGEVDATSGAIADQRVFINGEDVTTAIRSPQVTAQVSAIAAQPAVRQGLMEQQRAYGLHGGLVAEGRDIGTHVFPDAELKIFLTASVQERARRRQIDLKNQGHGDIDLDELERAIYERDYKDSTRESAPLIKAPDAIEIQTDGLTIADVVNQIVGLYQERCVQV